MSVLTIETALGEAEKFIASIEEYPDGYQNRGVVICGGGLRYFTNAWVCINMLRKMGCQLPVQLWYLGDAECDDKMKNLVSSLNVECVDGRKVRLAKPARKLNGWELKAYSILNSPFEEVVLLDSDNVPLIDPEILFESAPYKELGAIFWPDYGRLAPDRPIWKICGVEYVDEPEFESGQIVVSKRKCWKALRLAMWYNEHSDFYYHHIHGDKETFHMAFRKIGKEYAMPARGIHTLEGTMCQHDFQGNRIFQHRNLRKWQFFQDNPRIEGFLYEEECLAFLHQLRKLWNGDIRGASRYCATGKSETIKEIALKLCNQVQIYRRIGYDERGMTFSIDGTVELGAGGCEVLWDIIEDQGGFQLKISSESSVTCTAYLNGADLWKGKWVQFECMPIEISPCSEMQVKSTNQSRPKIILCCGQCENILAKPIHEQLQKHLGRKYGYSVELLDYKELIATERIKSDANPYLGLSAEHNLAEDSDFEKIYILIGLDCVLGPEFLTSLHNADIVVTDSNVTALMLLASGFRQTIRVIQFPGDIGGNSYSQMRLHGPCIFGVYCPTGMQTKAWHSLLTSAFQEAFPNENDVVLSIRSDAGNEGELHNDTRIRYMGKSQSMAELSNWLKWQTAFITPFPDANQVIISKIACSIGRPVIAPWLPWFINDTGRASDYILNYEVNATELSNITETICVRRKDLVRNFRNIYTNRALAGKVGEEIAAVAKECTWEEVCVNLVEIGEELATKQSNYVAKNNCKDGKVITMIAYNRPNYTKMVLDSLSNCENIADYKIVARLEPGCEEVVELFKNIDFAETDIKVNKIKLGCGLNTFNAWQDGFKKADFIIHIEDDTVPAWDCLKYMEFCSDRFKDDESVFSVAAYNNEVCRPEQRYHVARREAYTCWLVGLWANRWSWARKHWNRDSSRYAVKIANSVKESKLKEIYPLLSRSQNIGVDNGLHVPSAEWHHRNHHASSWAGGEEIGQCHSKSFVEI